MKKIMFSLTFTLISSLSVQAFELEVNSCSFFNNYGDLIEDYQVELERETSSKNITHVTVKKRAFYNEDLIYQHKTHNLIGSFISLTIPTFLSFDEWKLGCPKYQSNNCTLIEYDIAKKKHETDSRWRIYPFQILKDDKEYYVISSNITVIGKFHSTVDYKGSKGLYKRYASTKETAMTTETYIHNAKSNSHLLQTKKSLMKFELLDNEGSYRLLIIESGIEKSVLCQKSLYL